MGFRPFLPIEVVFVIAVVPDGQTIFDRVFPYEK